MRLQEKGDASLLRAIEANIRESDTIRRTLPAGNPFDRTFRRLYYWYPFTGALIMCE
jgi:hypothetical protein